MIRICMEVREGAALSRATVQAESIREAVSITRGRYPGREVRVIFPIDAEDFFIEGPAEDNGSDEAFCRTVFYRLREARWPSLSSPLRGER
jgi:hypothetical protein